MDPYALHLAMAALVGASAVAISAYFMHRKTLSQLLELARAVDGDIDAAVDGAVVVVDGDDSSPKKHLRKRLSGASRRMTNGYYRQGSASLPDVTVISGGGGGMDGEEKRNGMVPVEGIPAGLPWLHTVREGIAMMN